MRCLLPALVLFVGTAVFSHAQIEEDTETDRLFATLPPEGSPAAREETADLSQAVELTFQQVNAFRESKDLRTLETNEELKKACEYFADYMAKNNVYGHHADGKRPSTRAANHDYDYCVISENLAYAYKSTGFTAESLAEQFVQGWKESKGHRENMLGPHVYDSAVAIARSEDTGHYVAVQMFGRPKDKSISFRMANRSNENVMYTLTRGEKENEFQLPPSMTRTHEMCRPGTFDFDWMDDVRDFENDTQYVLRHENDEFRIETEPMDTASETDDAEGE